MVRALLERFGDVTPAILPSLLQCDFGDLRGEVERLAAAGARVLHLDVMDGHFVPNLTYGMPIVEGLRRHTDLPLDVHLMISDPLAFAGPMVDAGADLLTFHVEAVADPVATAQAIRELGVGVGVAVNPNTPMDRVWACAESADMVLVMSVEAGFGGQAFNPVSIERIAQLRQRHPELLIEIDGGIKAETIPAALQAGCDWFVVGSAIFGQRDIGAAFSHLSGLLVGSGFGGRS